MKWPKSDEKLIFKGVGVQNKYLQLWKKSLRFKRQRWKESANVERIYTPDIIINNQLNILNYKNCCLKWVTLIFSTELKIINHKFRCFHHSRPAIIIIVTLDNHIAVINHLNHVDVCLFVCLLWRHSPSIEAGIILG